jgi:hypothetical protein
MKPPFALGCLYKMLFAAALLVFAIRCSSDEEPSISYRGIIIYDINGSPLGCHQEECQDDWKWDGLSEDEKALIEIDPDLDISDAGLTGSGSRILPFPVPVTQGNPMGFLIEADSNLVFSIALVDGTSIISRASLILPHKLSNLQLADKFFQDAPFKTTLRMYYGLFNRNGEGLDYGYGDIAVCRKYTAPADYLDCLPE